MARYGVHYDMPAPSQRHSMTREYVRKYAAASRFNDWVYAAIKADAALDTKRGWRVYDAANTMRLKFLRGETRDCRVEIGGVVVRLCTL